MLKITRRFFNSNLVQRDLLKQMYLSELKAYKPAKSTAKVDLPETFAIPTAPAAPAFDKTVSAATADELIKEDDWPELKDPVDDPENYNDEWNFDTQKDDGAFYPKRVKVFQKLSFTSQEPHYHD